MLINLAKKAFEAASWPTTIDTGRYMFPLDDNTRNVADVKTLSGANSKHSSFLKNQESIAAISML
jgi:hypothetical protein